MKVPEHEFPEHACEVNLLNTDFPSTTVLSYIATCVREFPVTEKGTLKLTSAVAESGTDTDVNTGTAPITSCNSNTIANSVNANVFLAKSVHLKVLGVHLLTDPLHISSRKSPCRSRRPHN